MIKKQREDIVAGQMIQSVRECERSAAQLVKDAEAQAEKIVLDAENEKKSCIVKAIERTASERAQACGIAKADARELLLAEGRKTAEKAALVREKARKNMDSAVEFILKGINSSWQ